MVGLQIEELACYANYKLKVVVSRENTPRLLTSLSFDSEYAFIKKMDKRGSQMFCLHEFYPVLRPLYDITNEINGRCFIDQFEIDEDGNGTEYDFGNIKLIKTLEDIASSELGHLEVQYLPYSVVIKLLKKHYDIFGLINKGFAVDINTL